MTLDLDGPEPLYVQLAGVIEARIASGEYQPNRRVPSEADLVEEFGVARPTVRAAIDLLRERGLVRTVRGKGTFVVGSGASEGD